MEIREIIRRLSGGNRKESLLTKEIEMKELTLGERFNTSLESQESFQALLDEQPHNVYALYLLGFFSTHDITGIDISDISNVVRSAADIQKFSESKDPKKLIAEMQPKQEEEIPFSERFGF